MLNRIGKPNSSLEQKTETIHKKLCAFATSWQIRDCFTAFAMTENREQITDNRKQI